MRPTRRRVLGWAGLACGLLSAGCGGDDSQPGLYATRAQLVYQPGDPRFDYPGDIGVRVTVENTSPDRTEGTLVTTLEEIRSEDVDGNGNGNGNGTPAVVESWRKEQALSVSGGTTRSFFYVFEDVVGDGQDEDSFRARATIRSEPGA